jgi:cysteinyl-tRNA synthetase
MATRYLGEEFDIHGGGLDLRFPHHENELAQSTAAGHGFARHWLHNGLVNTGGQKMSKSLGNSLFADDLLGSARPVVLRYFLGSAHYRSVLEFSESSLAEAAAAFGRIERYIERYEDSALGEFPVHVPFEGESAFDLSEAAHVPPAGMTGCPADFDAAMLDDFNVPKALAVLHETVRAGNIAFDGGEVESAMSRAREVAAMLQVLGLDPRGEQWSGGAAPSDTDREQQALDSLVSDMIAQRREARANKDFQTSDAIRDQLAAAGIALEDTQNETRWSLT